MNDFHKHRAAGILACYSNVDEIIEKAHPVGYINKNGYQKQADGSYKYMGKAAKLKAQAALQQVKGGGHPLNTVSKKPDGPIMIKLESGWAELKDFITLHGGEIPSKVLKEINYNDFALSPEEIKATKETLGAFESKKKVGSTKKPKAPKYLSGDDIVDRLTTSSLKTADLEQFLSQPDSNYHAFLKELDIVENYLRKSQADESYFSSVIDDLNDFFISFKGSAHRDKRLVPDRKARADFSKCTLTQTRMINAYTGSAYRVINRYAGGSYKERGYVLSNEMALFLNSAIEILNTGINNIENLDSDLVGEVYRGFQPSSKAGKDAADLTKERAVNYMMNIGNSISLGTITSTAHTSTDFGNAAERILYKINNKKGKGKLIADISEFVHEREVLFPTTTQFRVKAVSGGQSSSKRQDFAQQEAKYFVEMDAI